MPLCYFDIPQSESNSPVPEIIYISHFFSKVEFKVLSTGYLDGLPSSKNLIAWKDVLVFWFLLISVTMHYETTLKRQGKCGLRQMIASKYFKLRCLCFLVNISFCSNFVGESTKLIFVKYLSIVKFGIVSVLLVKLLLPLFLDGT